MEGFGTDCYVVFNRLADASCENVSKLILGERADALRARIVDEAEAADREPNSAPGLFDAQSRVFDAQSPDCQSRCAEEGDAASPSGQRRYGG